MSFLAGLIGSFTDQIMNFVRQTYANSRFEVLYPPDVNELHSTLPSICRLHSGRPLSWIP